MTPLSQFILSVYILGIWNRFYSESAIANHSACFGFVPEDRFQIMFYLNKLGNF